MNIDELFGYCQYRDDEYIFNFKNYDIQFIPSSSSKIITNNVSHTFEPITEKNDKGFISDFILEGMLFDGRKIIFCIQDNPGYKNGIWNYMFFFRYVLDTFFLSFSSGGSRNT